MAFPFGNSEKILKNGGIVKYNTPLTKSPISLAEIGDFVACGWVIVNPVCELGSQ